MRCYDGAPDSELKAWHEVRAKAHRTMKRLNPEAHCTYFPVEEEYSVWVGIKQITKDHKDKLLALNEAIVILSKVSTPSPKQGEEQ